MSDTNDQAPMMGEDDGTGETAAPANDELWSSLRERGLQILRMIQDDEAAVRENWRSQEDSSSAILDEPDTNVAPLASEAAPHLPDKTPSFPPAPSWVLPRSGAEDEESDINDTYLNAMDLSEDIPTAPPVFPHFTWPEPVRVGDAEPISDDFIDTGAFDLGTVEGDDARGVPSVNGTVPTGDDPESSELDVKTAAEILEELNAQYAPLLTMNEAVDPGVTEIVSAPADALLESVDHPLDSPLLDLSVTDQSMGLTASDEPIAHFPSDPPPPFADTRPVDMFAAPDIPGLFDTSTDLATPAPPGTLNEPAPPDTPAPISPDMPVLPPLVDVSAPPTVPTEPPPHVELSVPIELVGDDDAEEWETPAGLHEAPPDTRSIVESSLGGVGLEKGRLPSPPIELVDDGTEPEEWEVHAPGQETATRHMPPAPMYSDPPANAVDVPKEANAWDVPPSPVEIEELPALPAGRYSDRELSWLAFNTRVLDLAHDRKRVPLLERAKFLAIFSSNLDEFFMVRVAGLKRRIDAGMAQPGTSGLLPRELHEAILSTSRDLVSEQSRVFIEEVLPELADQGILIVRWPELTQPEKERLNALFTSRIFPILTPLAVDPSHPFPYISGLSLNLAVQLRNPATGQRLFARIKVPNVLARFLEIGEGRFVPLEDVIASHLDTIFPGMEVIHSTTFRVTRNEDLEVEEDDAENILFALEKELLRRKVGRPPVRLEVEESIDPELLETLAYELDITTQEIFFIKGPLDLTGLFAIADIDRESLKYPSFLPKTNPQLAEVETSRPADMFAALKKRDVLLHHPYDSFATSVQRFIEQAAADPQVLAIKQTLYRTSGDSPIVDALIEAARAGKQVLALVEIKARFDERANIAWARKLEKAGVHVVYGLVGLKTHCKLSLVIRDEGEILRRYCHIGTGNYNPKTARLYEDMGLLTSDEVITDDVARLFNHLSGMTAESRYSRLLISPFGIRNGLIEHINHEIHLAKAGRPGRIRIKVNSIVDEASMDALYRASQAGVRVDLWVRGICALRGGVPGLSENIRVRSILGRFLEHSRLFWFDNDGDPLVGIGSADLMHRNLDRRVETLVRLTNPSHITQIGSLFDKAFDEGTASWWLTEEGWEQRTTNGEGDALTDLQEYLIQLMGARRTTTG